MVSKRKDIMPGFAGQGIGMIDQIRPAADVLCALVAGADEMLSKAGTFAG